MEDPFAFRLSPLAFYFVQHELKNHKTEAAAAISKKHQTFTISFLLPSYLKSLK